MNVPKVSVVVPVYNGEDVVGACVRGLADQTLDPDEYEIVVVDDGSTDATAEAVEVAAHGMRTPVRLVRRGRNDGPAAARNAGLRVARADVVAFTDADCVPARDWLERGLLRFAVQPQLAGVEGRTDVAGVPGTLTHQMRNTAGGLWMTCNMFYRRDAIERAGGFDERFRAAFLEDSDLAFAVQEQGGEIAWDPDVVVHHQVLQEGRRKFWRDARKRFYNPLLYRKHPDRYREHLRPVVPALPELHVLAMLGLLSAIVLLVAGQWLLALLALLAWLFYLRRLAFAYRARDPLSIAQVAALPFVQTYWVLRGAVRFRTFSIWL